MKHTHRILAALGALTVATIGSSSIMASTKISMWTFYPEPYKSVFDARIQEFMRENPSIKVVHSVFDWSTIQDKYLSSVIAGSAPEVVLVSSRWMVQLAYAGAFAALDPLIARDRFNADDVYRAMWQGVTYAGQKYAMPFAGGIQTALWYNKDLFAEVGLDGSEGPKTWSAFTAACSKLSRDKNGDGKLDSWGVDPTLYFAAMLLGAGGDWMAPDGSKVLWNSDAGVNAMSYIVDLWNKYRVVNPASPAPFEQGKVGIHFEGPYMLARIRKVAKFNTGIGIYPQKDGMADIRMWASSDSLALSKKPNEKMEAGWKLIKFLMRADTQAKWSVATGFPPMVRSARVDPVLVKAMAEEPLLRLGGDLTEYAHSFYPCIKDKDLEPLLASYQNLAIAGKLSPKMAVDDATDEANKLIARLLKIRKK